MFGSVLFRATESLEFPPPLSSQPARLLTRIRDPIWDGIYAPVAMAVAMASESLNFMQFLTIRRYLTLVFLVLIALLLVLAIWP